MLASRPDIVREDYMTELCLLQVSTDWGGGGVDMLCACKADVAKLSNGAGYAVQSPACLRQPLLSISGAHVCFSPFHGRNVHSHGSCAPQCSSLAHPIHAG